MNRWRLGKSWWAWLGWAVDEEDEEQEKHFLEGTFTGLYIHDPRGSTLALVFHHLRTHNPFSHARHVV